MESVSEIILIPSINYDSPKALRTFLEARGLGMRKKFGQNFLIHSEARRKLVEELNLVSGDKVWEIGPGLGAMTIELLSKGARVRAFEIDHGFVSTLKELFAPYPTFHLVEGDVLKTWKNEAVTNPAEYLFGNLPYNIAATVLGTFMERGLLFRRMVVTVQREVAQRMAALPASDNYSSFSVLCASYYRVRLLGILKSACFYPAPQIDSQGVLLELREDIQKNSYPPSYHPLIRALFSARRKKISHNLQSYLASRLGKRSSGVLRTLGNEILSTAGIDGNLRAERLGVDQFLSLTKSFEKNLENTPEEPL